MSENATNMKQTITVAMSNFLDSGAIVAGASSLTLWVAAFHMGSLVTGLLGAFSANGFGAAVGALIGGPLADKYGRKFIYKYDLWIYMIGMAIMTFSVSAPMLMTGFLITGIAVGAVVPASWTYLGEQASDNARCASIGWGQFTWSFGPLAIYLLSLALSPLGLLGSRIVFGVLFVVALVNWVMQQQIEESRVWVEQKEKEKKGLVKKMSIKEVFSLKVNRQALLLAAGIYLFWNLVAGLNGFFLPYIFNKVGNLNFIQSDLLNAVLWLLTVVATMIFIKKGDKWNRKTLFIVGCVMEVLAWGILVFMPKTWFSLIAYDVLWGVSAGFSAQCFESLWVTELFKTDYRGAVQGFIFFIVRAGVGAVSIVFPLVMSGLGFTFAGVMLIAFLVIQLIIGVALTPETRGMKLGEILKKRYGD